MEQPPPTFQVNGAEIRKRRMEAGLGTSEAARRAGISRRYLNHLENGYRTRMRPQPYAGLRDALGLEADDNRLLVPTESPPEKR
ncbi:helix-turn-helix domain-containing protein [Streptomyces sp. NPDC056682]|jgi:transcriptional regulator with XRE-family HTH domain|uniref:helix-turn-helix domain-containing protein n=1 Tax=Streptomyces sp. NPDC056682 TaxID=3345909 RepID=UPI0036BC49EC